MKTSRVSRTEYSCVLTLAGTDPSGGAGIQADIKAISATGAYAASVITVLVAQNTQGVQHIQEIPVDFIEKQLDSVFSDLCIKAVKIGMLHNKAVIDVVVTAIKKFAPPVVVLDPVMVAKNNYELLQLDKVDYLKQVLMPYATLVTPNIFEAEQLAEQKIQTPSDMEYVAKILGQTFRTNVLVKGGHLETAQSADVLYTHQQATYDWFYADRILTRHTHGTGCTLSSAIASYLAQGYALKEAVHFAKQYITQAIQHGSVLKIGQGRGPVDHFYFLSNDACRAWVLA